MKYIIWNEWQKKKLQNPQIGLFWFKFSRLAHVSMVFTGNRSNVKNFRWQTCSVLNLANLAILCQKWGVRDGAVVRGLASHQSGLGSANPGVDFIRVQSLLLVLSFAPRGFSPGTPVFPSPQKPTFPNTNRPGIRYTKAHEKPLCGCATSKSLVILFIYLKWSISSRSKVPVLS